HAPAAGGRDLQPLGPQGTGLLGGPPGRRRVVGDRRGPGGLAGGARDEDLVPGEQPHLHDGDEHEHDQRQHERELDGGLAAVGPPAGAGGPGGGHSPFMSFLTTPSNRPVKLPVLPTQAMMPRAMPPASRITIPYSYVAFPRSSVDGRAAPTSRVSRR